MRIQHSLLLLDFAALAMEDPHRHVKLFFKDPFMVEMRFYGYTKRGFELNPEKKIQLLCFMICHSAYAG